MIFSKTFNSEIYSQIVCMLDDNKFVTPEWMKSTVSINFYFYVDGSVHSFSVGFGDTKTGLKLRQEYFDGITAVDAQAIVCDKLEEGKI